MTPLSRAAGAWRIPGMDLTSLRSLAGAAAVVAIRCLSPPALHADDFKTALLDVSYAKPVRTNVGASLFLAREINSEGASGLLVGGSVGPGGLRAWGVGVELPVWFRRQPAKPVALRR